MVAGGGTAGDDLLFPPRLTSRGITMAKATRTKILAAATALLLLLVAVPIANLFIGLPNSQPLAAADAGNPLQREALGALAVKCSNCHTRDYLLPWYATVPPARGIIETDIRLGLEFMDMPRELADPAAPVPNEAALAKIEYTVDQRTMPPVRYLALHWDGALTGPEREEILAWIEDVRVRHFAADGIPTELAAGTLRPIPPAPTGDPAKIALGEVLYNDPRLSADDTISCATCHDFALGGTDQAVVSTGVNGLQGPINAPTVFNAVYNLAQFWDGRAVDLQDQAGGPVENPLEMATTFPEVIPKLNQDADLRTRFEAVYPDGFTKQTITDAIARFEETLVTLDSPFDRHLAGETEALTPEQKQGYELFVRHGCAMCHVGEALGGQSYEKLGRYADYFARRGGELTDADLGRYGHTRNEADKYRFKVPLLRNIALTYPYFHDGSTSDLAEAVQTMAEVEMGTTLSPSEIRGIVAFLNAQTGTYQGQRLDAVAGQP